MAKQSEATLLLKIKSAGESVLSKTKSALTDLRTWAAAAFAALTSGAAVMAFKEAEEATNRLNQALINNGIYSKELAGDYEKMAKELQGVTIYEDDAIKAAQAQMQAYLGQTRISKELMTATLDLAAAKKMDLASAAEMVGKSVGTSTNALARQGIELDKNLPKSERMTKVIEGLQKAYGGQAEAQAQGLGSLTQMKNAVGDLLEAVGEKLAPFIIRGAQAITTLAQAITSNQDVVFYFEMALQMIAKVAATLKLQFLVLKDVITATFDALYGAITAIASGDFKGAIDAIAQSFGRLPDEISGRYKTFRADMATIDDIYVQQKLRKQQEEIANTKRSEERRKEIQAEGLASDDEFFKARDAKELEKLMTHERLKNDVHLAEMNRRIANEKDETKRLELELEKRRYMDEKYREDDRTSGGVMNEYIRALGIKRVGDFLTMLNDMEGMQNSKNKLLVGVGKAAAIANIAINTANASMGAHAAMSSIPVVGPGLGVAAASSIIAYGAERSANVAGIQLAEGGIVKATPGGVHAIIGEGGRDEAVIPLDDRGGPLMGTTINMVVYGGVMGDAAQAREFMKAVDEGLFRLRQSNESIAFDRGVI